MTRVKIENPALKFVGAGDHPYVQFQGRITFPNLPESSTGTAQHAPFDFTGNKYVKRSSQGIALSTKISLPGPFNITEDITEDGSWHIKDLEIVFDREAPKYQGPAKFKTPDDSFDAEAEFTADKFTVSVGSGSGVAVKFLAMSALVNELTLEGDQSAPPNCSIKTSYSKKNQQRRLHPRGFDVRIAPVSQYQFVFGYGYERTTDEKTYFLHGPVGARSDHVCRLWRWQRDVHGQRSRYHGGNHWRRGW